MNICCENMNQHIKSFAVHCETGVLAQSTTGKRIVYNFETDKYEFCSEPSKFVMKRTEKKYCVSNIERHGKSIFVDIFSAEKINKHGLNWKKEAKCEFDFSSGQCSNYFGNTDYWLKNWDSLNNNILREPYSEHFSFPETVRGYFNCPDYYCKKDDELNLFQFLHKWFNGTLEEYINATKISHSLKDQKFGVEIEFTGMTKRKAADVIARYFGTSNKPYFKGISCFKPIDKSGREWKITNDSSISARDENNNFIGDDDDYCCELVTPILSYKDIPTLQEIVRQLRHNGMRVNATCGIHVHVDDDGHTPFSIMCLVKTMRSNEEVIYKALDVAPDRIRSWCKRVNPSFINRYNSLKDKTVVSMEDIKRCWYGRNYHDSFHYHDSRYVALNLHSLFEGKGIEFRLFNSVTHAGKVKAYIQFCLALSNYAKNHPFTPYINRRGYESSEYFEKFLCDLKLTGDEFKTARLHLLAVLKEKEERRLAACLNTILHTAQI